MIQEGERVERGNEDDDSAAPIAKGHFKILEFSKKGVSASLYVC